MKGYKNSTKTVYETEESANYAKGGMAKVGKVMGEFKRGKLHSGSKKGPEVTNPKQAIAIGLSEARKAGADVPVKKSMGGLLRRGLRDVGAGQMVQRVVRKAEGGSVKKPRPYDPVKDEPTSRPLTADEVRNIRNRMKAAPPKPAPKRDADWYMRNETSQPGKFAKGGSVKSDMAQDKATVRTAVHKHERAMHPGKPLTKMRNGGKVGC